MSNIATKLMSLYLSCYPLLIKPDYTSLTPISSKLVYLSVFTLRAMTNISRIHKIAKCGIVSNSSARVARFRSLDSGLDSEHIGASFDDISNMCNVGRFCCSSGIIGQSGVCQIYGLFNANKMGATSCHNSLTRATRKLYLCFPSITNFIFEPVVADTGLLSSQQEMDTGSIYF